MDPTSCRGTTTSREAVSASPGPWRKPCEMPEARFGGGALVTRILTENKRVHGVEIDGGERFHAPLVVSNANPVQTYLHLIGRELLPPPFIYKLEHMEPSCSLITLYLGLDCPAREIGIDEHTLFFNHTYDLSLIHI